ncbi:MAG: hypothetical protein R2697_05255 [Ilumatobacteraceae bacterium]
MAQGHARYLRSKIVVSMAKRARTESAKEVPAARAAANASPPTSRRRYRRAGSSPRSTTSRRPELGQIGDRSNPTSDLWRRRRRRRGDQRDRYEDPGCRPLGTGELSGATAIEAFTAVLLQLNVRYKTRVAPQLWGIQVRRHAHGCTDA